ncbi:MurT ligase domain-containing protein [Brevibacterium album]|uniref:MurT ligase domain-containing protein n=1 Tax=Brevibacterium album TaxID=417948 RepID=UPI000405CB4E|nr:MurT ligase domain-containing protein [Brevibacterium album]
MHSSTRPVAQSAPPHIAVPAFPVVRPLRARAVGFAARLIARTSRALGWGSGTMTGGRLALRLDSGALARLGLGRTHVLVTGTNGKSTTSRLLAAALTGTGPVAEGTGANQIPGLVAALAEAPAGAIVALETRERDVGTVLASLRPAALVLLNLSSEHADRPDEAAELEAALRARIAAHPDVVLIANCDDVRIASVAAAAPAVVWVAAGIGREGPVRSCPRCGALILAAAAPGTAADPHPDWRCSACSFSRPRPHWSLDREGGGHVLRGPEGFCAPLTLQLPGEANLGNAAQAVAAAVALGAEPRTAVAAVAQVHGIGERYSTLELGEHRLRLLLGKNPPAAQEGVAAASPEAAGTVIVLNAQGDETRDTAWVWDVDYSALGRQGRAPAASGAARPDPDAEEAPPLVLAAGDRAADLSVRLTYDGVPHVVETDVLRAVARCAPGGVDVLVPGVDTMQALMREATAAARRGGVPLYGSRVRARSLPLPLPMPSTGPDRPCAAVPGGRGDGRTVRIGLLLPELLAASGDRGNALVLRERLRWRGFRAEILPLGFDDAVPADLDLCVLGGNGGEEQRLAVAHLGGSRGFLAAAESGVPILAVRAGAQLLGEWFEDRAGRRHAGLGLLDAVFPLAAGAAGAGDSVPAPRGRRTGAARTRAGALPAAGEVVCSPLMDELSSALSGVVPGTHDWVRGSGCAPLGRVLGSGREPARVEGAVQGGIIATDLQGPVLARSPELADVLLARALRLDPCALTPLDIPAVDSLRGERLTAV